MLRNAREVSVRWGVSLLLLSLDGGAPRTAGDRDFGHGACCRHSCRHRPERWTRGGGGGSFGRRGTSSSTLSRTSNLLLDYASLELLSKFLNSGLALESIRAWANVYVLDSIFGTVLVTRLGNDAECFAFSFALRACGGGIGFDDDFGASSSCGRGDAGVG